MEQNQHSPQSPLSPAFEDAIGEVVAAACELADAGYRVKFFPSERRLNASPRYEIFRNGAVVEVFYGAADLLQFVECRLVARNA